MRSLRNYVYLLIAALAAGACFAASSALATETVITNQVSVSARSGGQTVSGQTAGTVSAGQTRVKASIKTIINGETVTDWQEEQVATSSGEVKIEKTFVNQVMATGTVASTSVAVAARVATATPAITLNKRWLERWWSQFGWWWWQLFLNKR